MQAHSPSALSLTNSASDRIARILGPRHPNLVRRNLLPALVCESLDVVPVPVSCHNNVHPRPCRFRDVFHKLVNNTSEFGAGLAQGMFAAIDQYFALSVGRGK